VNKVAIAFSTKDQIELSRQTLATLAHRGFDLWWADGSRHNQLGETKART